MNTKYINLYIEQGEDWEVFFNLQTDVGDYVDLSGYTIDAKMSKNHTSSIKYSLNPQIVDEETGLVKISIPNNGGSLVTKTQDLKQGRYVYNIFVTDNYNTTEKIIEGIITVNPSVL